MGMEQVWLLPAIPVALFALMALFNRLVPRRGDFIVILGMAVVVVLALLVLLDFQGSFTERALRARRQQHLLVLVGRDRHRRRR